MWTLTQEHTHEYNNNSHQCQFSTHTPLLREWSLGTRGRAHITELLFATHVHVLKGWTVIRSYTHHFVERQRVMAIWSQSTQHTSWWRSASGTTFTARHIGQRCGNGQKVWSWCTLLEKAMLQCIIFLKVLSRVWKYTQVSHSALTAECANLTCMGGLQEGLTYCTHRHPHNSTHCIGKGQSLQ